MAELERALALMIAMMLTGAGTEDDKDELTALLETLNNRYRGGPYHKTYRGAHALERWNARKEERKPVYPTEAEVLAAATK